MREPLLDPRMMGSFHSIFIVNTKALHLFHSRMVTAFCTLHHSPIIVVYALCRDVLLESLQIFALSPEMIKKNDKNQMTWKGTMDLYPFLSSCICITMNSLKRFAFPTRIQIRNQYSCFWLFIRKWKPLFSFRTDLTPVLKAMQSLQNVQWEIAKNKYYLTKKLHNCYILKHFRLDNCK